MSGNGMISAREVLKEKRAVESERNKIFEIFIKRISDRIRFQVKHTPEVCFLTYTVPEMMFGYPVYHMGECLQFLLTVFDKQGFVTRYLGGNTILISWDPTVLGGGHMGPAERAGYRPTTSFRPTGAFVYRTGLAEGLEQKAAGFR